ncbi:MAG TPA: PP2C family protein-serine/threonine phosphatase [Phycicoccus sp.]|nr:PP2C family protein-serine/threonine phosphatase [Phycicoccus sp.]
MTAKSVVAGRVGVRSGPLRTASARWRRSLERLWRPRRQVLALAGFALGAFGNGVAIHAWPDRVPTVTLALWVVLAALFLPTRHLFVVYAVVATVIVSAVPVRLFDERFTALVIVGVGALMVVMAVLSASRARLGIVGLTGEDVLVDLRDRLAAGGRIPVLTDGWEADDVVRSADGEPFSGDFLVCALTEDGRRFEVVLVDVSGKGRGAGSRSLHLSGAVSGLLGSVTPEEFLPAANAYLLRQEWDEGFATAVHLAVDLVTGAYTVGRAGHPPSASFDSGSGAWLVDEVAAGPPLGVVEGAVFVRSGGELASGGAVLLYSDGVVESEGFDVSVGVERMLGAAAGALMRTDGTLRECVEQIVDVARAGQSDDRAVFAIRRR